MLRLDYLSCVLTVASTVLVGRRCWEGWALAGVNSVVVCVIGFRTAQLGFIPANVFCMVMSADQPARVAQDRERPEDDGSELALTPQSAGSRQTATAHRSIALRSGIRLRAPSRSLHRTNICGCFPSRWFLLLGTRPRLLPPEYSRSAAACDSRCISTLRASGLILATCANSRKSKSAPSSRFTRPAGSD